MVCKCEEGQKVNIYKSIESPYKGSEDWDDVPQQVSTLVLLMWAIRDNKDCQPQSPYYLGDAADQNTNYFLLY